MPCGRVAQRLRTAQVIVECDVLVAPQQRVEAGEVAVQSRHPLVLCQQGTVHLKPQRGVCAINLPHSGHPCVPLLLVHLVCAATHRRPSERRPHARTSRTAPPTVSCMRSTGCLGKCSFTRDLGSVSIGSAGFFSSGKAWSSCGAPTHGAQARRLYVSLSQASGSARRPDAHSHVHNFPCHTPTHHGFRVLDSRSRKPSQVGCAVEHRDACLLVSHSCMKGLNPTISRAGAARRVARLSSPCLGPEQEQAVALVMAQVLVVAVVLAVAAAAQVVTVVAQPGKLRCTTGRSACGASRHNGA